MGRHKHKVSPYMHEGNLKGIRMGNGKGDDRILDRRRCSGLHIFEREPLSFDASRYRVPSLHVRV